jgi:uncharacterized protein (TIGR02466 family)
MPNVREIFPSLIYQGQLPSGSALNKQLKREIKILSEIDTAGQKWSKTKYVNGYSSYASETNLHHTSPYFGDLAKALRPHVSKFVKSLEWDLLGRKIEMTTCWANQMGQGTHHTLHLHPLSVLSGVYFVESPKGSSPFKIEDPRIGKFMASPPRKSKCAWKNQTYIEFAPKPGTFLLFESWMKHEVPPHRGTQPRLSISFNYEWI